MLLLNNSSFYLEFFKLMKNTRWNKLVIEICHPFMQNC